MAAGREVEAAVAAVEVEMAGRKAAATEEEAGAATVASGVLEAVGAGRWAETVVAAAAAEAVAVVEDPAAVERMVAEDGEVAAAVWEGAVRVMAAAEEKEMAAEEKEGVTEEKARVVGCTGTRRAYRSAPPHCSGSRSLDSC